MSDLPDTAEGAVKLAAATIKKIAADFDGMKTDPMAIIVADHKAILDLCKAVASLTVALATIGRFDLE